MNDNLKEKTELEQDKKYIVDDNPTRRRLNQALDEGAKIQSIKRAFAEEEADKKQVEKERDDNLMAYLEEREKRLRAESENRILRQQVKEADIDKVRAIEYNRQQRDAEFTQSQEDEQLEKLFRNMVNLNAKPFGLNAKQKYIEHLQNIIHIHDIYKLVGADNEYIDLFTNHKIEEGTDDSDTFKRTLDIAYVDIPCRIDKVYYDMVQESRFIDAIGNPAKVSEIGTQLKENIATEMTEDINIEVEHSFTLLKNYRKGTNSEKVKEIVLGQEEPTGNMFVLTKTAAEDMGTVLDFVFNISSRMRSRNAVFQKGYFWDYEKDKNDDANWEQIETNTPSLKRIGIVLDSRIVNKLSTEKYATAYNLKYVDLKERFA
ncbi:10408_t:CDS:2 [Ambispora gerdemannii]|uniref:10408_t:CDS:1 n=1 Tax=Ambispora gerdemannii TaxID=144530 RepID=A0A9N9CCC6_9GLOM|nr:10408_t:CDS:2 [Ambispora gerdemannii]